MMLDACLMVHGSWLKSHGQGSQFKFSKLIPNSRLLPNSNLHYCRVFPTLFRTFAFDRFLIFPGQFRTILDVIQGASRSPPGRVKKALFFQEKCKKINSTRPVIWHVLGQGQVWKCWHFWNIFLNFWGPSGSLFGVLFSSRRHFGSTSGSFLVLENGLGHQWWPKGRQRDVSTI